MPLRCNVDAAADACRPMIDEPAQHRQWAPNARRRNRPDGAAAVLYDALAITAVGASYSGVNRSSTCKLPHTKHAPNGGQGVVVFKPTIDEK